MKKYISEFVGTFVLVLIGCGVAVISGANLIATSMAFGLVIVAMAYSIGNVSGCHINPAVSFSMYLTKQISLKEFGFYVISQILGAICGALVLGLLFDNFDALGANGYADGKLLSAFIVEVILTFIFVLVILGVTSKKENGHTVGIVIGLTLLLVHLFGIAFTGTSVNPARSIGPAIFQGGEALKQLWVFILAPMVGSLIASVFYKYVLVDKK